ALEIISSGSPSFIILSKTSTLASRSTYSIYNIGPSVDSESPPFCPTIGEQDCAREITKAAKKIDTDLLVIRITLIAPNSVLLDKVITGVIFSREAIQ